VSPQFGGRGGRRLVVVADGVFCSPVVTSYGLPIVTIGLSLAVFAGYTAVEAPLPFRLGDPALCGSHPLVTP